MARSVLCSAHLFFHRLQRLSHASANMSSDSHGSDLSDKHTKPTIYPLRTPGSLSLRRSSLPVFHLWTKATDEEDDPLGPDEFQRFISATPTTVATRSISMPWI